MKEKSITFLLPERPSYPMGGYKVVFEYANYLAKTGFEVHIVYSATLNFKLEPLFRKFRSLLRFPYWYIIGYSAKSWFNLDKRIKEHWVISLNQPHVPKSNFYVATARPTSKYLKDYDIADNQKLYFIQGFENWGVSDEMVYETYSLGLKNIVISKWLKERVEKTGSNCTLIRSGFDFEYFKLREPVEDRSSYIISMLYHDSQLKGCEYGIKALIMIHNKYPQLKALLFGTPKRPDDLPGWIDYYQRPDKETHNFIYNTSSIYLAPSLQEGWGLTVGEAMICGNAIVCTNTLGFQEMVTDKQEGLIVPTKNSNALAEALLLLIENPELRIKMANSAIKTISEFKWEKSFKQFETLLNESAQK